MQVTRVTRRHDIVLSIIYNIIDTGLASVVVWGDQLRRQLDVDFRQRDDRFQRRPQSCDLALPLGGRRAGAEGIVSGRGVGVQHCEERGRSDGRGSGKALEI